MTETTVPPYANEAEQAVIGGVLIDNSRWPEVADMIATEDFYIRQHQVIWEAMEAMVKAGQALDVVTVSDELKRQGGEQPLAYLGELAKETPSAANIVSYAWIVRDKALRRRAMTIAHDLMDSVQAEGSEAIDAAIRELMSLSSHRRDHDCDLGGAVRGAVEHLDELYNSATGLVGVPSGLVDLDNSLGGFHDSDLVVFGARPSMGKTAFMVRCALSAGVPVGIISAEQPREQLGLRYLAQVGRVSVHRMRRARMSEDDWPRITNAVTRLEEHQVRVYDRPAPTIEQVEREARKWAHRHGIRALFVDYLQKLRGGEGDKRQERVGDVVQRLKNLARELNIPVIALSQVARQVEQRPNKRPHMGDVADSSEIEKEADVIGLLYRDEVYHEHSPDAGLMEVIIDKNRHGPVGTIKLTWIADYMLTENYAAPETSGKDRAAGE